MKFTITIALLAVMPAISHAQKSSSISLSTTRPRPGEEVMYTYTPRKGLALRDSMVAYIINCTPTYNNAIVPLVKKGNSYIFSYSAPASAPVLAICIGANDNKTLIDVNDGKMFTVPLYNSQGQLPPNTTAETAYLLNDWIRYGVNIHFPAGFVTNLFTTAFKLHPEQRDKYYPNYLSAKVYDDEKDATQPLIKTYIVALLKESKDEKALRYAYYLCVKANMIDEATAVQQKIIEVYPTGEMAKDAFISNLDKEHENADKLVAAMQEYFKRFGDSSQQVKNMFYGMIVTASGNNNDWANIDKYEALITDRRSAAAQLNNLASMLAGGNIDSAGTHLVYAATLAKRAMQVPGSELKNNTLTEEVKARWQSIYDNYANTYAHILYKLGNTDSAYYYENAIAKTNVTDVNRELLARCVEKLQGDEAARKYIEEQLTQGSTSALLQQQLQLIYTQLSLPQSAYDKVTTNAKAAMKAKAKEDIEDILGTTQAKNFALKDLNGKTVTLASLRNKVVVLDFWATWCGPCKASFPAMQQAVTKYKDDKEVVFLFLDVWENGDESSMRKNAAKFIQENKYTFRVLVDHQNKVPPIYKVGGIPTKFIVDKQGNIAFMFIGNYVSDLAGAIEEAKKQGTL